MTFLSTVPQALKLHMGCALAGPAGTGKTETTKDLAAGLGKCCYVFNCSPEMDYDSLGDIFKGAKMAWVLHNEAFCVSASYPLCLPHTGMITLAVLKHRSPDTLTIVSREHPRRFVRMYFRWSILGLASSGAWGCFDEFNRLEPEVLSVCSLQFKAVTDGLKAYAVSQFDGSREDRVAPSIVIEDDRVPLDPGFGVFITMNPGYLGRSELPEGLKVNWSHIPPLIRQ